MFSLNSFPLGTRFARFASAAAAGVVTAQLSANWLTLCGNSPASLMAFALGLATGLLVAGWAIDFLPLYNLVGRRKRTPAICLAILVIFLCSVTPEILTSTLLAGTETSGSATGFNAFKAMLFPALSVAMIVACSSLYFQSIASTEDSIWVQSFLFGSVGVLALLLHSFVEWPLAATSSAAIIVSLIACRLFKPLSFLAGVDESISAGPPQKPLPEILMHFGATGILLVGIIEGLSRLFPVSLPVLVAAIGITAAGVLGLSSGTSVRVFRAAGLNTISLLILALFPVLFAVLGEMNLWGNTNVGSSSVVIALRALQLATLLIAAVLPAVLSVREDRRRMVGQLALLAVIPGILLGLVLIGQGFSPVVLLAVGILCQAIATILDFRATSSDRIVPVKVRSLAIPRGASMGLLLIPVIALCGNLDSTRISSLIFSPRTAAAIERGVDKDLIAESDANRLLVTCSGASGELSVWRRAGNVVEFQRNGISLGRVSTDIKQSPQPAEEVLPGILAMANHEKPGRVLILGDDTGACLRSCSHFPVQEIVAIRSDMRLTSLVTRFTWSTDEFPADKDSRVRILHAPQTMALRDRGLKSFDVIVASSESPASLGGASEFTSEYYFAVKSRMLPAAVFCQRFRQQGLGPEALRVTLVSMSRIFLHVGMVQIVPGEIALIATDNSKGLVDHDILARLQRDHVRREIASTGWDWSQIAVLPLIDAGDPIGIFSKAQLPKSVTIANGGFIMQLPFELARVGLKSEETRLAFGAHQIQLVQAIPHNKDHDEVQRRLTALAQQTEILAGMPDQPWTYRKSLRMEMQRSPRPPLEVVQNGEIVKSLHPLDLFSRDYFQTLGSALKSISSSSSVALAAIGGLERFTENPEPLLSYFAHYEIVRLHELAQHPSPADELRHRLHIVFFSSPSDASVRPVISALDQLVNQPALIEDPAERYDMLNSLLQKLIERWEARTAWEPRSALRVQNDVDQSVRIANLALDQMETNASAATVRTADFLRRRRYINAALISPLRNYRDQVLAHRQKTEIPAEPDSEDPNDMPLLLNSDQSLHSN